MIIASCRCGHSRPIHVGIWKDSIHAHRQAQIQVQVHMPHTASGLGLHVHPAAAHNSSKSRHDRRQSGTPTQGACVFKTASTPARTATTDAHAALQRLKYQHQWIVMTLISSP